MDRSVLRGVFIIAIAAVVIIGMLVLPSFKGHEKQMPPNDDPWALVSYDPYNSYGTYLGNGFISCRIMGEGVGSHNRHNRKPLPCYMAGLYDNEKLIPTPTWSDLQFHGRSDVCEIDMKADYKQILDMNNGILTTYGTWIGDGTRLKGSISVIVSRAEPGVALIHAKFISERDEDNLHFGAPVRNVPGSMRVVKNYGPGSASLITRNSGLAIGLATDMQIRKNGRIVAEGSYYERKDEMSKYRWSHVNVKANDTIECFLWRSISLGTDPDAAYSEAEAALKKNSADADAFISNHKTAWAKLWERDIIIDGPKKDQQALRSCMFYLLQSVREGSQWSIPPMGLSDNAFSGHVFWDADTWMFPALILQHPELARSILDYRYNTLKGALANAKNSSYAGAEYAWESGYSGIEDTPEGLIYRHERHINGDIALAQWQYYLATNDLDWLKTRGYPVLKETADYWVSRVKLINGRYEIHGVVPPDENADIRNNSAYTNCIAQMNIRFAMEAARITGNTTNPKWREVADKMYIPYDSTSKRFIAFDDHKTGWVAKQADTELLAYPLQYKINGHDMTEIYKNTFDYYSNLVHKNSPAMATSAYSVITARLGNRDRAYKEFVASYRPYFRGPFNYFNEKASETYDNMCFLTGAAGPIQATLFGLAGGQMNYFPTSEADYKLSWKPCLPKQWKSLKIKGVQWRGETYDVVVTQGDKVELLPK